MAVWNRQTLSAARARIEVLHPTAFGGLGGPCCFVRIPLGTWFCHFLDGTAEFRDMGEFNLFTKVHYLTHWLYVCGIFKHFHAIVGATDEDLMRLPY